LKPIHANSSQKPDLKILNTKKAGGVAQMVECLSSKNESLTSNPNTTNYVSMCIYIYMYIRMYIYMYTYTYIVSYN
jgi:hypothetical protein